MKKKSLLIISDIFPSDGGSIYIKKNLDYFFEDYEIQRLVNFDGVVGILNRLYYSKYSVVISRIPFFIFFRLIVMKFLCYLNMRKILSKDITFTNLIVATEDLLAYEIVYKLKIKKHCNAHLSILDFPWTYKNSKINNVFIKKYFLKRIKNFDSAEFVSKNMNNISIANGFSGRAITTNAGIDLVNFENNSIKNTQEYSDNFSIVFTGNLRFKNEIIKLLNALDIHLPNQYKFNIFSEHKLVGSNIINHDFCKSKSELIEQISSFDVGFVPMSFSPEDKELVETSFPSKASTYLLAGIPILVLAPSYSEIYKTTKEYQIGEVCDLENLDSVVQAFSNLKKNDYTNSIYNYQKEISSRFSDFKSLISK